MILVKIIRSLLKTTLVMMRDHKEIFPFFFTKEPTVNYISLIFFLGPYGQKDIICVSWLFTSDFNFRTNLIDSSLRLR